MNGSKGFFARIAFCLLAVLVTAAGLLLPVGQRSASADVSVQQYDFRAMVPYKIELQPSADAFGVFDYVKEGITRLMVFSPDEMYGISQYGSLVTYAGNDNWSVVYSGYSDSAYRFSDIWGSSKTNTYLINNNQLYLYNGADLTLIAGVDNPARVWGTAAGDVYVARSDAGLYHYAGSAWSPVSYFSGKKVTCIGGLPGRVYAGAADGLYCFDGAAWTQVAAGKAATCVGTTADGKVIACYGKEVTWQGAPGGAWTSLGQAPFAASRIEGSALDDLYAVMNSQLYLRKNDGNWYLIKKSDGSQLAVTVTDFHAFARRDFLAVGLDNPYGTYYFSTPILYHYDGTPTIPPPTVVDADREVTAYVRVEGYDHTIIPRTKITLQRFDLGKAQGDAMGPARGIYLNPAGGSSSSYSQGWGIDRFESGPTAMHILLKALTDQGYTRHNPASQVDGQTEFDVQDYGWSLYVAMIGGDREFDHGGMSGWLYRVNGWLPNYGAQAYALQDGDDVVWSYSATGFDAYYVNFKADRETVTAGQAVNFTLTGETTDLSGSSSSGGTTVVPVPGAGLLIDGQEYKPGGSLLTTGANGQAAITFDTPGTYVVSCENWNIFGAAGALRPASIRITVNEASGSNHRPAADSQSAAAAVGVNYSLDLGAIFTDSDGDSLTYSVVGDDGAADAALNPDGHTLEYTPAAGDAGNSVAITVKANDGQEDSDPVTVTLAVAAASSGGSFTVSRSVYANGRVMLGITSPYPSTPVTLLVTSNATRYYIDQFNTDGGGSASVSFSLPLGKEYVAAVTINGEKQELAISTSVIPDTTPPSFADDYPQVTNTTATGCDLAIQLDEPGTAYYKLLPQGEQITPGEGQSVARAVYLTCDGSIGIPDTDPVNATISGLTPGAAYDLYLVAMDTSGNLQTTPAKLSLTTASPSGDLITRVRQAITDTTAYAQTSGYISDWIVVGLRNAGAPIPDDYLASMAATVDDYFANTVNTKSEQVTAHERRTLAIVAAGGNPRDTGGHDLLDRIYNFYVSVNPPRDITFQGLNGPIYGLIALDTMSYPIPDNARYSRDYLIQYLLSKQNTDGGWDLSASNHSDVDITAMTLIGLAPYHAKPDVMAAIDRGVAWLSQRQDTDGGYTSWGTSNSESISQTVIALCANGIDPTSPEFTKNGHTTLDALLTYQQPDGSIWHTLDGSGSTGMSTEQGYQALLAYDKFVKADGAYNGGQTSIYYFEDITPPQVTVTGLTDGQQTSSSAVTFTVAAEDNKDTSVTPVVKLNQTPLTPGSGNTYTATLAQGANSIEVSATDASGNNTTQSYTVHCSTSSVPVTGLTLEPDSLTLTAGGSASLTTTIAPTDATDQGLTWTTSDETVASIVYSGANGTVTGHVYGTATITVTTNDGGYTKHCAVTVNSQAPPAGAPVITPSGGSYDTPQSITVSISADLAVDRAVYYTIDGSDPTVAGSVYYTEPFSLYLDEGTTTVQAAVYDSGTGIWSGVNEVAFIVAPPVQNSYDLNGDEAVNVQDLVLIGQHFAETGTPGWIPEDINQDGRINIQDLVLVGQRFSS